MINRRTMLLSNSLKARIWVALKDRMIDMIDMTQMLHTLIHEGKKSIVMQVIANQLALKQTKGMEHKGGIKNILPLSAFSDLKQASKNAIMMT